MINNITINEARARCINPKCIPSDSRYLVANSSNGEMVEGHLTKDAANIAAQWCNEHEERNGRQRVYNVIEVAA